MTEADRQEVLNIIINFMETYGSQVGSEKVVDLTEAEMTDENLTSLIIPAVRPTTKEWVQTTLKTMMRPITRSISDLDEVKRQTLAARDAANDAAASVGEAIEEAEDAASNADTKAEMAETSAGVANNAASNAAAKADYAQTQGLYAKQQGDAAALVDVSVSGTVLTVKSRTGSTKSVDTKGEKGDKGEGIDYSTMTAAEKQALTEYVAEEIAQQGGYVLYPVEEGTLSPTSTFRKNAIICIDAVIYRAVRDTQNLPLKFVVEGNKFVVQTLYGRTALVRGSNDVSSDWAVWADASNDIRFRQLEDRVARLETFH